MPQRRIVRFYFDYSHTTVRTVVHFYQGAQAALVLGQQGNNLKGIKKGPDTKSKCSAWAGVYLKSGL